MEQDKTTAPQKDLREIISHANPDYPVGVYYVEPLKMYMEFVRWHWHEELEINYIKEGTAVFSIGEDSFELRAGQAIMLNSNVLHSIRSKKEDPCVILSLMFHPSFLFDVNSQSATLYLNPILNDNNLRYFIFDRKDIWSRGMLNYVSDVLDANLAQEFGYELLTKSILSQIWFQMVKHFKVQPDRRPVQTKYLTHTESRIKDAILYIETHYHETVSLEDIADSIHVSKSECCRCFKRAVNLTPFEYLMKYRVLQAAERILQNDESASSIANLALSVGFNNTSYFNKLFKEYFGCTPLQYRKTCKTEHRDTLSHFGLSLSHI